MLKKLNSKFLSVNSDITLNECESKLFNPNVRRIPYPRLNSLLSHSFNVISLLTDKNPYPRCLSLLMCERELKMRYVTSIENVVFHLN
jgi:hypothetical protein